MARDEMLTVRDARELLGLSDATVYTWINDRPPRIKARKIDGRWHIPRSAVDAKLAERAQEEPVSTDVLADDAPDLEPEPEPGHYDFDHDVASGSADRLTTDELLAGHHVDSGHLMAVLGEVEVAAKEHAAAESRLREALSVLDAVRNRIGF